jgi:hypothetical protein
MHTRVALLLLCIIPFLSATAQNVGIGTASPSAKLHVNGQGTSSHTLQVSNDVNGVQDSCVVMTSSGNVGIGTIAPSNRLSVVGDANVTGKIGIGMSSPNANIDVQASGFSGNVGVIRLNAPDLSTVNSTTMIAQGKNTAYSGNQAEWKFKYITNGSPNNAQTFGFNGDFPSLTLTANRRVGIGTTAPNNPLSVSGQADFMSGNVGVGTTTPSEKIHIIGKIRIEDGNQGTDKVLYGDAFGVAYWQTPWLTQGSTVGNTPYWNGTKWVENSSNIFNNGTNVGIGTSSPSNKLTVNGSANFTQKVGIGIVTPLANLHVTGPLYTTPNLARAYFHQEQPYIQANTSTSGNIQVIAAGWYWADGGGFLSTSDQRIKKIIHLSNKENDLSILNKIQITDYTYIDHFHNGAAPHKKVIAQQLQEVFPQAVNTSKGVIPNVFDVASNSKVEYGKTIIATFKPHTFKNGDQVKLILENTGEKMVEVTVIDPNTFTVDEIISDKIFVYGKMVDDLLNVDYDAVSMLNVSATQELYKRLLALEKENLSLNVKITDLETEISSNKTLANQRLTSLETKLDQLLKSMAQVDAIRN